MLNSIWINSSSLYHGENWVRVTMKCNRMAFITWVKNTCIDHLKNTIQSYKKKSSFSQPIQILNDVLSHCIILNNMEMHVPEKYYFEPNINKKTGLCLVALHATTTGPFFSTFVSFVEN